MTASEDHIRLEDGVVVHDHLIFQDDRGTWWGYNDGSVLLAPERDALLIQVAEATGTSADLADLRGRFDRAVERVARRRTEDEALEVIDGK
jgi:hypothetical protein